eukprot:scaffold221790_cov13-Tisochrysis_lutea.AAC.1
MTMPDLIAVLCRLARDVESTENFESPCGAKYSPALAHLVFCTDPCWPFLHDHFVAQNTYNSMPRLGLIAFRSIEQRWLTLLLACS